MTDWRPDPDVPVDDAVMRAASAARWHIATIEQAHEKAIRGWRKRGDDLADEVRLLRKRLSAARAENERLRAFVETIAKDFPDSVGLEAAQILQGGKQP